MPNVSQITIVGHVGRDAELKYTQGGQAVLEWTVAVNTDRKNKDAPPAWFRCSLWGKRGESLKPYVTKGATLLVMGEFAPREYADREGKQRVSYDVRVSKVALLGGKGERQDAPASRNDDGDIPF